MAKIKEIKSAPKFDEFLLEAQEQPIVINSSDKKRLHRIYEKMKGVMVCGNDEYRNIWFHIERGAIEDYGDYEESLEEGIVSDRADSEEMWLLDYPDPVKWYDFSVNEYNGEYFFYIDSKLTFHIAKELPEYYERIDIKPLISYLEQEVNRCVDWLQTDEAGYNRYVNLNLSYNRRTGKILRRKYWEIFPEGKKQILKGINEKDIELLQKIVDQSREDAEKDSLQEMTAGNFFEYCKMGYEANNYFKGKEMPAVEMYKVFADGRHEGLTDIDLNSPKAFANWYAKRSGGGHPWEVCRGGTSTHISLYVERRDGKWFLRLGGSSVVRVNETVKFAIALYNNHVPFYLSEAEEIYNMICGTDYIGIVPQEVFPGSHCYSLFPEDEEQIIDFMNLDWEESDKIIAVAEWYSIDIKSNTDTFIDIFKTGKMKI